MKTIGIIPARYGSSRFPGKPLANICGKPMIWWVYNTLSQMREISETRVATDDERIFRCVSEFGGKAIMTGECASGTDRVAEACRDLDFDIVLNIQGDEPMVRPELIRKLLSAFDDEYVKMATLRRKIDNEMELRDPNIAKLIINNKEDAIYFSRSEIPYNRENADIIYYKHIGIYGYTRNFLFEFVSWPQSSLEKAECLEQLRVIENGYAIRTVETQFQSIGVDLPEHIKAVEKEMESMIK
ncbi:MAG: 3-deoxy-manno-octulosonate cytidylyltransferase [Oscillospiraceae bacterium]|nr:3-deoxy-manno-octulosonate cytidylyltransferase [Oscillospiraceae bacterium]